ncbi:MAG: hypothetical protein KF875_12755 [Trueperaceae bacterium]|nr:hypothetical protein [Trueperaceae bacterium]MCO5175245.1 hypothetical protein [Trueperaceae bacterium]MCW5819664.1 hypothetical protein [Trueperaceae bacterium]
MLDGSTPSASGPERITPRALERRVKRWLLEGPFDCYVQVAPGHEALLASELLDGGFAGAASELRVERGGIALVLDHAGIMRANLELRTASRVLLRLREFPAASPEMLYDRARGVPWLTQIGFAPSFGLHVTSRHSKLQAGDAVATTVASAVARELRPFGLYPKPAPDAALVFHVHLQDDRCTVSLDTSGGHLHRRGVRRHVHTAPVRETLAAAMVMTGLRRLDGPPDVVLDPFCGSGTLLIEAADALAGLAPGRHRAFAFEKAAWFRAGAYRETRRLMERGAGHSGASSGGRELGAEEATTRPPATHIVGIDSDSEALEAARANLARPEYAGVSLEPGDSTRFDFAALGARRGLVLANLPYGVRLGERREASATARAFLERLVGSGGTWEVVLLTTDAEAVLPYLRDVDVVRTRNGGLAVALVGGRVGGAGGSGSS